MGSRVARAFVGFPDNHYEAACKLGPRFRPSVGKGFGGSVGKGFGGSCTRIRRPAWMKRWRAARLVARPEESRKFRLRPPPQFRCSMGDSKWTRCSRETRLPSARRMSFSSTPSPGGPQEARNTSRSSRIAISSRPKSIQMGEGGDRKKKIRSDCCSGRRI